MSDNHGKSIIDSAADTVTNRANPFASDLTAPETPLLSEHIVHVLMSSPKQGLLSKKSIYRILRRMPRRYTPK